MEQPKEYFAFISYKREDEKWAKWLANELEHHHLPKTLNDKELPKNLRPIFRDVDELSAGNLPEQIYHALSISKNLIVVCSPRAAKSEWVEKEITDFIKINDGKSDNIYPFIIEGTPFAKNPIEECFPAALKNLPENEERIGGNINETGGKNVAVVKTIAGMLGVSHDSLWNRYEREQKRKRNWIFSAAIIAFLCISIIAFWMYWQKQQTEKANWKMMENRARAVAEKASSLVDECDSYTAQRLLLEVMPEDLSNPNRPYTVETERILRNAVNNNSAILRGHSAPVNFVTISPDGKHVVSASGDNSLMIWDVKSGEIQFQLIGHSSPVTSVAYSPDGELIASASYDKTVRIWKAVSGTTPQILNGHRSYVNFVTFSPDGKYVLSSSGDATMKIWDVENGSVIRTITGHKGGVTCAVYSPDGKYIASSSKDSTIKIWDVETYGIKKEFNIHLSSVNNVSFSPDGKSIVSASKDGTVIIWDVVSSSVLYTLKGHSGPVWSVSFSRDGSKLVSASTDRTLRIWDVETGEPVDTLNGHSLDVFSAIFNQDGSLVISASKDETLRVWDIRKSSTLFSLDAIYISYCPNGKSVLATSKDKKVRICDVRTGIIQDSLFYLDSPINTASYSPDGMHIVTSYGKKTDVWNLKTQSLQYSLDGCFATFSPDGKYVVTNSFDLIQGSFVNTVRIWSIETGANSLTIKGDSYVNSIAFSPNGKIIMFATDDKTLEQYDSTTGYFLQSFKCHSSAIYDARFSHDGKYIVSASEDGVIKKLDAATGSTLFSIEGHTYRVHSVSFSPDGKRLLSASGDKTVRIWDAETGLLLQTLKGFASEVYHASFSPDGEIIVSSSYDGETKAWYSPPLQLLINQVRARFKKVPLSPNEKEQYYLE